MKKAALFGMFILALVRPAMAAIVLDAVSTQDGSSVNSLSWSHTCGGGTGRALVVCLGLGGGSGVSSASYGGNAMTVVESKNDGANWYRVVLCTLLNPPTGLNTISITLAGNSTVYAGAASYTGVTAVGAHSNNTIQSNTISGSLATSGADSVICGIVEQGVNSLTDITDVTGGIVDDWTQMYPCCGASTGRQFHLPAPTATTYTPQFNFANNTFSLIALVELVPIFGTPTITPTITLTPTISPTFTASPVVTATPFPTAGPSFCSTWEPQPGGNGSIAGFGDAFLAAPGKVILTGGPGSLANGGAGEAGSIWAQDTLDVTASFSKTYRVFLGNIAGGSSGITFCLQTAGDYVLGSTRLGLGYGIDPLGTGGSAFSPSLAVAVATQDSGGPVNGTISVLENGSLSPVAGPVNASASGANIKDAREHDLTVAYNAGGKTLTVFFDGAARLSTTVDLGALFGGSAGAVTYGFTGATDSDYGASSPPHYNGNIQYFTNPQCLVAPNVCSNWILKGTSAYLPGTITAGSNIIQLTPNYRFFVGAAWSPVCAGLGSDFDFKYDVNLGSNGSGADGICFVLQSQGTDALGTVGGAMGIAGITPAVAVEIDTFANGGEPVYDHIAVDDDGTAGHSGAAKCVFYGANNGGAVQASATQANIKDGASHSFEVKWTAAAHTLDVYFDGTHRLTYTNDIAASIGQSCVTYGYTASTGYSFNQQIIVDHGCVPTFTNTPTATPTVSLFSPTQTPTYSLSPSRTATLVPASATASRTPTPTSTVTAVSSPANTATVLPTATPTPPAFYLHGYPNSPNPVAGQGTWFTYYASRDAEVRIAIYTVSGELVRELEPFQAPAGYNEQYWEGGNSSGHLLASGVFIYRVEAVSRSGDKQSIISNCAVIR